MQQHPFVDCQPHDYKSLLPNGRGCRANSETDEGERDMKCCLHFRQLAPQAQAPCGLTIRHSRFASLALAKLVASLALHPPISATGSGGLRASRRSLLVVVLANYRSLLRQFLYSTTSPWHADFNRRGRAQHGHRGKRQKRAGGACSRPSGSSFSLPRGLTAIPPPSFIQAAFTSHIGSLFLS